MSYENLKYSTTDPRQCLYIHNHIFMMQRLFVLVKYVLDKMCWWICAYVYVWLWETPSVLPIVL